jgi:SNF2 family DNA or RNA helicase
MSDEWFEVAYINFDEAILHGQKRGVLDEYGVRSEERVRVVLTDEQKRAVEDLNERHRDEMNALLRGMAV